MEQSREKLGMREWSAIVILLIGNKTTDDTPTILVKHLWNAAWMAPIIELLLAALPIYLLLKMTTTYGESFYDVIMKVLGKYIGYIILFSFWILGSSIMVMDSSIYTDIIGTMYYENTPYSVLYIVFWAICAYGATKGLQSIGSVAWIIFPYVLISSVIASLLAFRDGVFSFLTPIFGPGAFEIVKQSAMKTSLFADFLLLALLYPFIKSKKVFIKGTWLSLLIIIPSGALFIICYIIIFDYDTVRMLDYPFHELIKTIRLGSVTGPETLFLPFWLMSSFVRFSLYLYISSYLFGRLFRIQQFQYLAPILATIFMFSGPFFSNPTYTSFVIRDQVLTWLTPVFFLFPILLFAVAKVRGGLRNDKKS